MNALYALAWLAALVKWGDWKNWQSYYPTLLYLLLFDFVYQYLLVDYYPMWKYTPQGLDENLGLTHTHIALSIMVIKYPATIFIYLANFPDGSWMKKIVYVAGWVSLYAANEAIDNHFHLIDYHNGWSFWWSLLFNTAMFLILRIHHINPLPAWILSFGFIIFLWTIFDVPMSVFR